MKKILILSLVLFPLVFGACQNKKGPVTSSDDNDTFVPSTVKGLKTIYFDFDDSSIRSDQTAALQGNADYLKENSGTRVTIEGNCDERGTNEYNMALGDRRARSTKNYLVNLGTDSARMNTISYGEERPAATC